MCIAIFLIEVEDGVRLCSQCDTAGL